MAAAGFVSVASRPRHSPYSMVSVQEARDVILEHAVKNNPTKVPTPGTGEGCGWLRRGRGKIQHAYTAQRGCCPKARVHKANLSYLL